MSTESKPRVGFVSTNSEGSNRIRSNWPAAALAERDDIEVTWCEPAYPRPGIVDVVIVHRPLGGRYTMEQVQELRNHVPVIIQEDDNLYALPDRFLDEVIDREDIAKAMQWHADIVAVADGLIVTTPALAAVYEHRRTWVVPNYLRRELTPRRFVKTDEYVRVGWTGITGTHRHDLVWLAPQARQALAGSVFTTVGDLRSTLILGLEQGYERFPFNENADEFYSLQDRADIGIVPLDPTQPVNHGKSWLKALEYMLLGKPVVATNLPEQAKLIQHGITGFLANTPEEFAEHVQTLIRDEEQRRYMGVMARQRAVNFTLDKHLDEWVEPVLEAARIPV